MLTKDFRDELKSRDGCPVCDGRDSAVHVAFNDIPVLRCRNCGFLYSSYVLSDTGMQAYYAHSYGGDRHVYGQQVNANVNLLALERLLPLDTVGSILEVGSGYGFLLKLLKDKYGTSVAGVELSKDEATYASSRNGIPTHDRPLLKTTLAKESFDLVACFEVLEHVPDPVGFIGEMCQYLKPGGSLLIMTDNFDSAVVRRMGARFPKWIPHQHVSHFTAPTLRLAVRKSAALEISQEFSFTPWELHLQSLRSSVATGGKTDPRAVFELERELNCEMGRRYRLFRLRKFASAIWARCTLRPNLDGELMYLLARRV